MNVQHRTSNIERRIKKAMFIVFMVSFFSGCAHWDRADKIMFAGLTVACIADVATTDHVLDGGGEEKNPALRGNTKLILPLNILGLGVICMISDHLSPVGRKWLLGIANGIKWGCVVHNCNEM